MRMINNSKTIIVLGMHRSGTSLLAGLLHKNNIVFGEEENFIPKPSQENVKGFYENYLFRRINDRIIEKSGYRIKSWSSHVPEIIKADFITKYKMRKLLKKYSHKYLNWGWKDPRTCLTLKLWLNELNCLNMLNSCKILYILRHPYAVANSMVRRGNTNFENSLKLWKIYNERALKTIDENQIDTYYLSYEQLCSAPVKVAESVFGFLKIDFDEDIVNNFVDVSLNRSTIHIDKDKYAISDGKIIKEVNNIKERLFSRVTLES